MASMDLYHNISTAQAIPPGGHADDTPVVGSIIDSQGVYSITYVLGIGSVLDADATFTVLLEDGDDAGLSDAATAEVYDDVDISFAFDDDDQTRRLGYAGKKRYTRMTITPVNNASNAIFGAFVVQGDPRTAPTAASQ